MIGPALLVVVVATDGGSGDFQSQVEELIDLGLVTLKLLTI